MCCATLSGGDTSHMFSHHLDRSQGFITPKMRITKCRVLPQSEWGSSGLWGALPRAPKRSLVQASPCRCALGAWGLLAAEQYRALHFPSWGLMQLHWELLETFPAKSFSNLKQCFSKMKGLVFFLLSVFCFVLFCFFFPLEHLDDFVLKWFRNAFAGIHGNYSLAPHILLNSFLGSQDRKYPCDGTHVVLSWDETMQLLEKLWSRNGDYSRRYLWQNWQ